MTYYKEERTLIKIFNEAKPFGRNAQAIILEMYVQQIGPITASCESELDWSEEE